MFVYLFILRERHCVPEPKWGWDREGGRERIPSRLHVVSTEPDAGLEPTNCEIMTLAKVGHSTD